MNTANLCARICEIAYDDDPRPLLSELGFDLVRRYDSESTQAILTTGYLAPGHPVTVLAFPGTADWKDVLTDLSYVKTDFPGGGRVHLGFWLALKRVWPDIVADLERLADPEIYAGHSLGAALALEASALRPPSETHVYGCPRVGNSGFVRRLVNPVYRHENWFDVVTHIPPPISPLQARHARREGRKPTRYVHPKRKVGHRGLGHRIHKYVRSTS